MSKIEICFFTFLLFYFFTPTKTGSYPHEFLCRTVCSACVDYQPCIFITQDKRASLGCSHAAQLDLLTGNNVIKRDVTPVFFSSVLFVCCLLFLFFGFSGFFLSFFLHMYQNVLYRFYRYNGLQLR